MLLVLAAASVAGVAPVTAAPVTAAPVTAGTSATALPICERISTFNGEGAGIVVGDRNLKVAPYAHCANVARVSGGAVFYWHCGWWNDYGNYWMYGRVAGTSTHGWISMANIISLESDDDGDGHFEYAYCLE